MKLMSRRNRKKLFKKVMKIASLMAIIIVILGSSLKGVSAGFNPDVIGEKVIGINLGTTQSVVSFSIDGKTVIIPNDQGNRITPSIVGFTDSEIVIGDAAYNQMAKNSANTIFDVKRYDTCNNTSSQHHIILFLQVYRSKL